MEWLTQAEFASRIGVAPSSVSTALKSGRIEGKQKGARTILAWPRMAKIFAQSNPHPEDLLKHVKTWKPGKKNRNGKTSSKAKTSQNETPGKTLVDVKRRREHWYALKLKLEYEREAGQLLPATDLATVLATIGARTSKAMAGIPARTAAILAAERKPHAIRRYLDQEIRNALEGLARDLEAMGKKGG